jgi:hypothetical protein
MSKKLKCQVEKSCNQSFKIDEPQGIQGRNHWPRTIDWRAPTWNTSMTAQTPEILMFDNRPYTLKSIPLDPYLKSSGLEFPQSALVRSSTANYRGYVGCWEVLKDDLYLIGLFDPDGQAFDKSVLGWELPVKATWFSGRLDVDQGDLLSYAHAGWGSVWSKRIRLYFENGRFKRRVRVDLAKRLKKEYALTPDQEREYRQWQAERGHMIMGGLTRAGFDAIGREPFEEERVWSMDAGDNDDLEWMLPMIGRCTRLGARSQPVIEIQR